MTLIIREDFLEEIIKVSKLKTEPDSPQWAKWIDRVDETCKTGYAFVGDFINSGTTEVELGRTRLILAQASLRDDKNKHTGYLRQFRVVLMKPSGKLKATHIATDDRRGGWALRIRGLTANLLKDVWRQENPKESRFGNVQV